MLSLDGVLQCMVNDMDELSWRVQVMVSPNHLANLTMQLIHIFMGVAALEVLVGK